MGEPMRRRSPRPASPRRSGRHPRRGRRSGPPPAALPPQQAPRKHLGRKPPLPALPAPPAKQQRQRQRRRRSAGGRRWRTVLSCGTQRTTGRRASSRRTEGPTGRTWRRSRCACECYGPQSEESLLLRLTSFGCGCWSVGGRRGGPLQFVTIIDRRLVFSLLLDASQDMWQEEQNMRENRAAEIRMQQAEQLLQQQQQQQRR